MEVLLHRHNDGQTGQPSDHTRQASSLLGSGKHVGCRAGVVRHRPEQAQNRVENGRHAGYAKTYAERFLHAQTDQGAHQSNQGPPSRWGRAAPQGEPTVPKCQYDDSDNQSEA